MSTLPRQLRSSATEPERMLWSKLRNRQIAGVKFRRQHPIGPYVVDFASLERKLVIELDGKLHKQRKSYDEERTRMLEGLGFRVLRFRNFEIYSRLQDVITQIEVALTNPPLRNDAASKGSSPSIGGRGSG